MKQNEVKNWLVAQIKPQSYDLAIRNLERQGFETFLPKMKTTIKKEKKFINKYAPVFPGYIFVGVSQNSNWVKINSTYGVVKVLFFNEKASHISHDIILTLKNRYETKINQKPKENPKVGDAIKFNSGPFVDLIARVEALDKQDRIFLILEAMGGNRKLKLQQTERMNFFKL